MRNSNQGIRYLDNARNGTDQSVVSTVPVPFEVSGMPATPVETPRPVPVPISTLTSALASASPDDRTRVCNIFLPL